MTDGVAKAADNIIKEAATVALEATRSPLLAELKKGNNVVITGFGTFRVSHRAARTGVNPRNPSEKIKIKAMKVPVQGRESAEGRGPLILATCRQANIVHT